MKAELGTKPSFTWRSLWGARKIIQKGSRWLIGNGENVKVWNDRWMPRPYSFKPITAGHIVHPNMLVAELIDKENKVWKEQLVRSIFLPCDADIICSLSLCHSWPHDKLLWHFSSNGEFSVKSAYQVARVSPNAQRAMSSDSKSRFHLAYYLET